MDSVIRAAVVYLVLLVLFRLAGKRALSETTTFDFVLLLIISEAVQQAMIDGDDSMTNALIVVVTLVGMNILIGWLACYSRRFNKLVENVPLVIVEDGKPIREHMRKSHVEDEDVMTAARENHGIERMDQIKYAVLERSGGISIIPKDKAA